MQHCTSGWETGAPRSGHGFLPGQENEHAQWSASYTGLDTPWRPPALAKIPGSLEDLCFMVTVVALMLDDVCVLSGFSEQGRQPFLRSRFYFWNSGIIGMSHSAC